MGSDWFLEVIRPVMWTPRTSQPPTIFLFPTQLTCQFPIIALQGSLYQQTKNSINFHEDLCGLHKLQSDTEFCGGLLKYTEGFQFGGESRFSCFSLFRDFFSTKWTAVFQGKRKRPWKIKNGTANGRRLQRQTGGIYTTREVIFGKASILIRTFQEHQRNFRRLINTSMVVETLLSVGIKTIWWTSWPLPFNYNQPKALQKA